MGKKFLSFLGANNYGDTMYVLDTPSGQVSEESKYTQVVLLKNLCNSWDKSAKGYVFVTEEAKKANWESDDSTNTEKLKKQIEKLKEDGIINFEVKAIDIPRGFSQEEIWVSLLKSFAKKVIKIDYKRALLLNLMPSYS